MTYFYRNHTHQLKRDFTFSNVPIEDWRTLRARPVHQQVFCAARAGYASERSHCERVGTWLTETLFILIWVSCCLFAVTAVAANAGLTATANSQNDKFLTVEKSAQYGSVGRKNILHADFAKSKAESEWRIFSDVVAPNGETHAVRFVRGNAVPFVAGTQFEFSLDANAWISINTPTNNELGFFSPPRGSNFFIRVRIPDEPNDSSTSFFEQAKRFWLPLEDTDLSHLVTGCQ